MADRSPGCPRCRHPGFRVLSRRRTDGGPCFQCDKCRYEWSCGSAGGKYAGHEMKENTNG
jgi:transposase-like protein